MSAFSWLQKALEQHQQGDCKVTSEAEDFVNDYSKQVETAKRLLQERQEQERKERSSAAGNR